MGVRFRGTGSNEVDHIQDEFHLEFDSGELTLEVWVLWLSGETQNYPQDLMKVFVPGGKDPIYGIKRVDANNL